MIVPAGRGGPLRHQEHAHDHRAGDGGGHRPPGSAADAGARPGGRPHAWRHDRRGEGGGHRGLPARHHALPARLPGSRCRRGPRRRLPLRVQGGLLRALRLRRGRAAAGARRARAGRDRLLGGLGRRDVSGCCEAATPTPGSRSTPAAASGSGRTRPRAPPGRGPAGPRTRPGLPPHRTGGCSAGAAGSRAGSESAVAARGSPGARPAGGGGRGGGTARVVKVLAAFAALEAALASTPLARSAEVSVGELARTLSRRWPGGCPMKIASRPPSTPCSASSTARRP